MGLQIEHNTMLRLAKAEQVAAFEVGKKYLSKKTNLRLYPTDLPILLLQEDWKAIGYCAIRKVIQEGKDMELSYELLTIFNAEESEIITETMLTALRRSGYPV